MKNEELGSTGVPFVRASDISDGAVRTNTSDFIVEEFRRNLNGKFLLPGDVAFIAKGTVGRAGRVLPNSPPFVVAPQVCFWRSLQQDELDPDFLYYLLCGREFHNCLDAVKTHGSMAADYVSLSDQKTFQLSIPPIEHQRRIGAILSSIDAKIELNRGMNETLESMSRALFKSWFVDFDPVRRNVEGQPPWGLDAATATLFPDHLAVTDRGEVPLGWSFATFGSLFTLDKGVSYKGESLTAGGAPMINLGCFKGDGGFDILKAKGYEGEVNANHWVSPGDLLLANTDMTQSRIVLGSPALIPHGNSDRYLFSHHVFAARFIRRASAALKMFCYQALLQPEFRMRAAGFATGTTVLALPRDAVLKMSFVLPPEAILERFGEIVFPMHARKEQNDAESRTLVQLRDKLLPRLLAGELRLRDAKPYLKNDS